MVQYQLKLRLSKAQKRKQAEWLPSLGAVFNFGVRKIELNAANRIYFSKYEFVDLLDEHSKKLGIPAWVIRGTLSTAYEAWQRCFKKIARKPRLKGRRRPLNSIPFPQVIEAPSGNFVKLPGLGKVRFHKQWIPEGKIKGGRLVKRASGNYLCLFIEAEPKSIKRTGDAIVGIDLGFSSLLTLSTGEKIDHPREFRAAEKRIGQAQRGRDRKLVARLHEHVKNRRKDRNHKLSRRLVAENKTICFLKDDHRAIAKKFGKSVSDSGHGGLRVMLSYKCLAGCTELVFPENRNSTRICSTCRSVTGPTGLAGLKMKRWECGVCGARHDRDVNSARNALISGVGRTLEEVPV